MENLAARKIDAYIEEFFFMNKGEMIRDSNEEIYLDAANIIAIRRIGLKHIVESRIEDGYSIVEIKKMAGSILHIMESPEIDIQNTNKKYSESRIVGKLFPEGNKALLVIYQLVGNKKIIYNLFYREVKRFRKMK